MMTLKHLSRLLWLTIIVGGIIFVANPTMACSPNQNDFELTFEDRVTNAPIILVGRVTKQYLSNRGNAFEYVSQVEVNVDAYYRGEGSRIVRIYGFGQGADCLSIAPAVGEDAIFMAYGDPDYGLHAFYLGTHDAVWRADDDNLAILQRMTDDPFIPDPLPLSEQITRSITQVPLSMLATVAITTLMVLTLALGLWLRKQDNRKPKVKRS